MKSSIILTSDKNLVSISDNVHLINKSTLHKYDKSENVVALICSREIAVLAQKLTLPNLKLLQLTSAGWDNVDLNFYRSRNVTVCNAADVYSVAMAEYVFLLMLQSAKRFNENINNTNIRFLRNYKYITELSNKTVGIMGVGSIGSEVAKRAEAFGMRVIGYANKTKQKQYFSQIYHKDNIVDFVSQCDYLVVTLPHSEATIGLIDKNLLAHMKKHVVIVNVGRKTVFNQNDFLNALKSNSKMTALLDMFELFPNPVTNPYRRLSNVMVVPGVTAISKESTLKLIDLAKYNLSCLKYSDSEFRNTIN